MEEKPINFKVDERVHTLIKQIAAEKRCTLPELYQKYLTEGAKKEAKKLNITVNF